MFQPCLRVSVGDDLKVSRARYTEPNRLGRVHFQVNMTIGLDSKAKVVTGWFMNKGDAAPQLATMRPYRGKKDDY